MLYIFLIVIIIALYFMLSSFMIITIENRSMFPTFRSGEQVLVLRKFNKKWLKKGRIVIVSPWLYGIKKTSTLSNETIFIKRIIAVSGETLTTSIDQLDPDNLRYQSKYHDTNGKRIWYIPENHVFLKGDHPVGGYDSLSWGPIRIENVLGIVIKKLS